MARLFLVELRVCKQLFGVLWRADDDEPPAEKELVECVGSIVGMLCGVGGKTQATGKDAQAV
jgi:hypothetical protein